MELGQGVGSESGPILCVVGLDLDSTSGSSGRSIGPQPGCRARFIRLPPLTPVLPASSTSCLPLASSALRLQAADHLPASPPPAYKPAIRPSTRLITGSPEARPSFFGSGRVGPQGPGLLFLECRWARPMGMFPVHIQIFYVEEQFALNNANGFVWCVE